MKQYEIWWVDLDPVKGTETQKTRPCVVLSADVINQHGERVIIAPLLKKHKPWPYVVNVTPSRQNGVDGERRIDLTQMRAVDKTRITSQKGLLEKKYYPAIHRAIKIVLAQ